MDLGWLPTVSWRQVWTRWIVGIIFFNSLHTMLTWVGILVLPELRSWAKTQLVPKRGPIVLMIFVGIFLAVFRRVTGAEQLADFGPFLAVALLILIAAHNVGQTKGLSMLYNWGLRQQLSENELVTQIRCERRERWFFNVLVLSVAAGLFLESVIPSNREVLDAEAIREFIPFVGQQFVFGAVIIAAIAFVGLMVNVFLFPRVSRSHKALFSTTAIFHVLLFISPAAFVFQRALHGIEYLFLAIGASSNSKLKWRMGSIGLAATMMIAAVSLKVAMMFHGSSTNPFAKMGIDLTTIVMVGIWIEFTHYYIDSVMFRFSDYGTRKLVGPLLQSTEPLKPAGL